MKFLLIFLLSLNAFGQSSNPNDTLKIGDSGSGAAKGLIFDTNDGVSNKTLKVDATTKEMHWTGNLLKMGDGSSANDKTLTIDSASSTGLKWNGSDNYVEIRTEKLRVGKDANNDIAIQFGKGGSNPQIKYDSVKGKIRFSNDGSAFKDVGSGSGGGGENFNNGFTADNNANAEDGTTGWTASAGSFAVTSTNPLEGDQSFTWTPAAQNDTLDSPVLDFDKDILLGRSCQAQIEYIGGDENLTLQVIDADNDVLGSLVLQAHSISAPESVFFLCPASSGTANDKDIRLRLKNEGASASALIKFDKSYVGTLIGLSETVLPDAFGFTPNASTAAVTWKFGDDIATCSKGGTGIFDCDFSGTTSTPSCQCTVTTGGSGFICTSNGISATNIIFRTTTSAGALVDITPDIACNKTGADAKQSVQVYKSIPKVSENTNVFSAIVNQDAVVDAESSDWIDGNCTEGGADPFEIDCNFKAGTFSVAPTCNVTLSRAETAASNHVRISLLNPNEIRVVRKATSTGAAISSDAVMITCQKNGVDYKTPTVQPVIVGQVTNSYAESASKNVRVESCRIDNPGTPATNSELCDSWVDSLTDSGVGRIDINIKPGIFSGSVVCSGMVYGNYNIGLTLGAAQASKVETTVVDMAAALTDRNFWVICSGRK